MLKRQYRLMYENENHHWWFLAKREFIKTILPSNKKNLKILDVGCGTGGTSQFLQKWGNVTGVEPAKEAHFFLKKRKIKFLPDTLEKYSSKKKYDLICFLDVLYHKNIQNDRQAILKATQLLKKGGYLLITDCALPFFFGYHDQIMQARKRYYLDELKAIVESSGFKIIKASYTYFLVFPLFVFIRLLQKNKKVESVLPLPKLLNRFLLFLCKIEAKMLKYINFPFGSSVIILAERL